MRNVIAFLSALTLLGAAPLPAASVPENITLLLQFEKPASGRTMSEMKQELESVLRDAGVSFGVRLFSELSPYAEFRDLILVRVRGDCRIDARPASRQEPGPLALAHVSDGQVLPFMEVLCDRIRTSVRSALAGEQLRRADEYLGRALARVMAHEMYHILGKTCGHGNHGIARHSLSARHLVAEELSFDRGDLERLVSGGS